jgi:broad specificity phosphatase PhoE
MLHYECSISYWVIQQGEADKTGLTEHGENQVRNAFEQHLSRLNIPSIIHGGADSTKATAKLLSKLCRRYSKGGSVEVDPALGLEWVFDEGLPSHDIDKVRRRLETSSAKDVTAHDWLAAWPPSWGARERFTQRMLAAMVEHHHRHSYLGDLDCIVVVPPPLDTLILPKPGEALHLGPGDIVKYTVGYNDDEIKYRASIKKWQRLASV